MQERRNSIANALELRLSCTNPSIWFTQNDPSISCLRGAGPGCNTQENSARLLMLKQEIAELHRREQELDTHKARVQQSIRNVTEDVSNHLYPYVGHKSLDRADSRFAPNQGETALLCNDVSH